MDNADENCKIEIYDMMGKMVFSDVFSGQHISLGNAFEKKADGVYFLKVYSAGACETVKVVKE